MNLKTLLRAESAADLRNKVDASIANGHDLHSNIFIDPTTNLLCQWMTPRQSRHEYRLIESSNLEELENHVHNYTVLSFDFMYSTVVWNGKLLQWMYRACQELPVKVIASPAHTLLDNGMVDPEMRAKELQLVEGVRVALRMVPVDFVFSSSAPFPLA